MGFLFFKKKKKQEKTQNIEENVEQVNDEESVKPQEVAPHVEEEEEDLSPKQKEKKDRLKSLEGKISKILQSSNIEIVDENAGDEYELDEEKAVSEKQKQQDYEALKGIFGKDGKKKQELTLTIDDFDYTYMGKYVEEYDLVHMKNIKRIKLQNKYKKLIKKISFASVAVIVLITGGVLGYKLTRAKPVYLAEVSLSQTYQEYFVDEHFDYTGIYIYAKYSDGRVDKIKLSKQYFQSAQGNYSVEDNKFTKVSTTSTVKLFFQYNGFYDLKIEVKVDKKNENGLTCIYTDGLFKLKQGDVITNDYLINILEYSNYNGQKIDYSSDALSITVDGTRLNYNSSKNGFNVAYDIASDSEIVVKYNSYSLSLKYGEYFLTTVTDDVVETA